jgi:pilus assembly protein Flp/PilA
MWKLLSFANRFLREKTGATAVEYALLVALIAVAILAAVTLFGFSVRGLFQSFVDAFGAG